MTAGPCGSWQQPPRKSTPAGTGGRASGSRAHLQDRTTVPTQHSMHAQMNEYKTKEKVGGLRENSSRFSEILQKCNQATQLQATLRSHSPAAGSPARASSALSIASSTCQYSLMPYAHTFTQGSGPTQPQCSWTPCLANPANLARSLLVS